MRACRGVNFTSGMLLWCGIFFVPLVVHEVRDVSPTTVGLVLMPLMFGAASHARDRPACRADRPLPSLAELRRRD